MRLSTTVMAHPKRKHYVEELLSVLGDVPVVWDTNNNRWDTGRRALLSFDPRATHHMVVQDDAVVPQDLCKGVERMLDFCSPYVPISLYTGKSRPNEALVSAAVESAKQQGSSWVLMPGPWWGVAIVTPTKDIHEMVRMCDRDITTDNYDLRMVNYWRSRKVDCLYTVPSLVDHRDGPSLVPNRDGKGRHAHSPLPALESALSVEWNTRCVLATVMPEETGDIVAVDPQGRKHIVTGKSFRQNLFLRGWTVYNGGEEVSSIDQGSFH